MKGSGKAEAFLFHGNFFIAICGAVLYAGGLVRTGNPITGPDVLFVFLAILALYSLQRLVLIRNDGEQLHERQRFYLSFRIPSLVITLIALVGMLLLLIFRLSYLDWFFFMITGIISLSYFLPGIGLRKIGLLKPLIVGAVWGGFLAGMTPSQSNDSDIFLLLAERACFITSLALLFDIRDMYQDKKNDTRTWPVVLGVSTTKAFSLILFGLSVLLSTIGTVSVFPGMISGAVFIFFLIRSTPDRSERFYHLGVDGIILLLGALEIGFL